MYRKQGDSSWATREIAALDFLLNIPLQAEREIVLAGLAAEHDGGKLSETHLDLDHSLSGEESNVLISKGVNGTTGKGGWWDYIAKSDSRFDFVEDERIKKRKQLELETGVLERPKETQEPRNTLSRFNSLVGVSGPGRNADSHSNFIPGRRLDGHDATMVHIPREAAETELKTRHRTIARKAAEKEWEMDMIRKGTGLLDGRIFFANLSSYPVGIFSIIKYDPKNEEEFRQRKKLVAAGRGGTQFAIPPRDWRGISYRMLLPRFERKNKAFNRKLEKRRRRCRERYEKRRQMKSQGTFNIDRDLSTSEDENIDSRRNSRHNVALLVEGEEDSEDEISSSDKDSERDRKEDVENYKGNSDLSSSSSDESATYEPGFLDDPDIKKGKHRTAMVGDKVTGCIAASIIHYCTPADLKSDLNKQFRQRFDQWEPPKIRRKYIGAKVVDGKYKLIDNTESNVDNDNDDGVSDDDSIKRDGRRACEFDNLRMPPSLTLSKIRSIKQAALLACIKAKIEVSTVALACVYFERLALDCRVDKSNRRLTFATCLLIAIKFNSESNVRLVHEESGKESKKGGIISLIKPRKDSSFWEPLFFFFTHDWGLSLKSIFAAEFGVFAGLDFKLHSPPSEVSFHFKQLMKSVGWSPLDYLDKEMYAYWQESLENESRRKEERAHRKERRRKQRERRILKLQRELQEKEAAEFANQQRQRSPSNAHELPQYHADKPVSHSVSIEAIAIDVSPKTKKKTGMGLFGKFKKSSNNDLPSISIKANAVKKISLMHRSISSPNLSSQEIAKGEDGGALSHTVHVVEGE